MVYRIFVEKKEGLAAEAQSLKNDLVSLLGIKHLTDVRVLNRYDVENIDETLFASSVKTVFSEPQLDTVYSELPEGADRLFAVEYLPGQFDQRADSAAQCIQILSQGERPTVRTAKVYLLYGDLTADAVAAIQKYVINPVESRLASLEKPETLAVDYDIPTEVATVTGFCAFDDDQLLAYLKEMGLAMDADDIRFCQQYFRSEQRDPTVTEIKMIDTYWSDHCRHTTFSTTIDSVTFEDALLEQAYNEYLATRKELGRTKPINLMDIATLATKYLRSVGKLDNLDESEEINACTVKMKVEIEGKQEDWLLLFKNETHNHPTEIEPFGGAATCIGGAIRDPLSGRAYVYAAMRVTGAGNPLKAVSETLPGKLPQRKIVTTAAAGYSSYGNQIGLATGHVAEMYHDGYVAKRLECGAVVAAAPAENVRRERPAPGDVVILLGGRTGRDGIGGATGSSKSHNMKSLTTMASEVQKGNAPEERKIQRLFRDPAVTRLIKRCNDFGAGGVSVAIGELAAGLKIDLDAVRKKYEGLDGTEIAISESQERMAVVVSPEDADTFIALAQAENLEAYRVAVVTAEERMVMTWKGQTIADLSRAFLDTNGAVKHADITVTEKDLSVLSQPLYGSLREMAAALKTAEKRGLVERFDSTIGAGSVVMPYGGQRQLTPTQSMAATLPMLPGQTTDTASVFAWGCDPDLLSVDPYTGAHAAIFSSVAKLVAAGCDYKKAYLTLQEFFEKLKDEPTRWGKPFAALLGAMDAQLELGAAAIGGKDSMSGTFLDLDVPPTVISFAIAPINKNDVISPEFKAAGHPVYVFGPTEESADSVKAAWEQFHTLCQEGKVLSAWAVENGLAEGVMKMSFGNHIGFKSESQLGENWHLSFPDFIIAEMSEEVCLPGVLRLGYTTDDGTIALEDDAVTIDELYALNTATLEDVYPTKAKTDKSVQPTFSYEGKCTLAPAVKVAKPKILIPVFPGTNCEYDSARAVQRAGGDAEIFVVRNLTAEDVAQSVAAFSEQVKESQMIFIPGGFSGGDEPDGSAKFITAFFRNAAVKEAVTDLLDNRDGLMCGICNGFQALVKLGLVPYGKIMDTDESCPTLTFNNINRHQSRIVHTRIASVKSPWLSLMKVGDIVNAPISHGEGKFLCSPELALKLAENGQVATQYVDLDGNATQDIDFNPNGSLFAIEGITSPDGRVFGKMGHSERVADGLYKNVPGNYDIRMFEAAVKYFK